MGPLFPLLFWWLGAAVLTLVWFAVRPRKQVPWPRLLVLPALLFGFPIIGFLAAMTLSALEPPAAKFARVFGMNAPASITKLQASEELGSDTGMMYLGFVASTTDIAAITTKLQATADSPEGAGPPWWTMSNCPLTRAYEFESRTEERWDTKILFHCERTGQVLVRTRWVD